MTSKRRATLDKDKADEINEILGFEEPAGSLAPMDANVGKWNNGLDASALSELATIVDTIEDVIEDTVQTVARARLRVGKLLNEARCIFPGDKEFGQWRKQMLPDLAASTCNQYQRMAVEYGNAPAVVEAIGFNVAAELINKPDLQTLAINRASTPEEKNMTVKEARQAKSGDAPQQTTAEKPPTPPPSQIVTSKERAINHDQVIAQTLDKRAADRIEAVLEGDLDFMDDYSKSAMVFGFGPDLCDCRPNLDVFIAVYDYVIMGLSDEQKRVVDQAYTKLKEAWS